MDTSIVVVGNNNDAAVTACDEWNAACWHTQKRVAIRYFWQARRRSNCSVVTDLMVPDPVTEIRRRFFVSRHNRREHCR
jgi:hypothetical protein